MMITKDKTASKFSIAYFMLVPVVCLLLISFSNRPTSQAAPFEDGQKYVGEDIPSVSPIVIEKSLGIASDFGYRIDPITNKRKFHTGVDFRSSEGSLVMSTANGIVLESENDSSRGNFIVVKHGEMYMTSYSHLKSAAVTVGDLLAKGQTIGYVGNTGLSTAPHLHYEILKDGKPVDPKDYLPKVK